MFMHCLACNNNNISHVNHATELNEYQNLPFLENIDLPNNLGHLDSLDAEFNISSDSTFNYFSTHDFHSSDLIKEYLVDNSFFALHYNIRSLSANHDGLCHLIAEIDTKPSIIGLTEIKIKIGSSPLQNINIEGYQFIYKPSKSNAGGVGFYINDSFKFSTRDDLSIVKDQFESLWIEIDNGHHKNMLCGVIYRHPTGDITQFMDYLNTTLDKIHHENKLCTLMGDFNLDLLKAESHEKTNDFLNTLGSSFFRPLLLQPTRITDHTATLIDNIFINTLDYSIISGNFIYDLSDHLPNFVIVKKPHTNLNNQRIYKRDYSNLDRQSLLNDFNLINWEEVLVEHSDPDHMFTLFHNKLLHIIDKHIPLKLISRKKSKLRSKPWITKGIMISIQQKNKLYKKFIKTKSADHQTKFKLYRNKINHLIRISKQQYYNDYFNANASSAKHVWKGIKEIVNPKSNQHNCTINKISIGDNDLTDPKSISNAFNNYFANIGKQLADNIPASANSALEYLANLPNYYDSFYLFPTDAEEIAAEISSLKLGKSVGPFSVPVKVLKILQPYIAKPLEIIFNSSLATGIVPQSLKIAKVIPIFKKGSNTDLGNYRPISLLSVFDKILEKIVAKRMLNYIEKKNILYDKQFGFRSNYSTDYAILSIIDKIQQAIDKREFSCGIFLDMSKAFDTVNHQILIAKLNRYGFRGPISDWLTDYLKDRKQFVSIGETFSDQQTILLGVPQGSVLGPLLFLLYINDFHLCSNIFDFHLFADDASLFYKHKNLTSLQTNANVELGNIYAWLCANKLTLNITKSNYVLFHPSQRKVPLDPELYINNNQLKQEKYIKYLGILIDSNLSWKPHINYILSKVKRNCGILCKIRYFVDLRTRVQLYYSLIYPFLIYGILAWGSTYPTTLDPLFKLQKKVMRVITFSNFDERSSPLFKRLNVIKLNDIAFLYISVFMYKYHHSLLPTAFNNFFTKVRDVHKYNTRLSSKSSYALPKPRTNYAIFNIRFQGVKIWNSLSDNTKVLSKSLFKNTIIADVLSKY